MKINNIKIRYEANHTTREYGFFEFGERTLIWSNENSKGKTSLMRIIPFAMGFKNQPLTDGFRSRSKLLTEISIFSKVNIVIKRKGNYLTLIKGANTNLYELPGDYENFIMDAYGISAEEFEVNSFGFLIDQDNGWKVINRGKINNNSRYFTLEKDLPFLEVNGTKQKALEVLFAKKRNIMNARKSFQTIKKTSTKVNETLQVIKIPSDQLSIKISRYQLKREQLNSKLINLRESFDRNEFILSLLVESNLKINHKGDVFNLSKDNLISNNIKSVWFEREIKEIKNTISALDTKISEFRVVLEEKNEQVHLDIFDEGERTTEDIVNKETGELLRKINSLTVNLDSKLLKINSRISELLSGEEIVKDFEKIIMGYSSDLGIDFKKIISKEKWVELTGSRRMRLVLIIRIAFNKMLWKYRGISVPMIIDSPAANEFDAKSIVMINKMLSEIDSQLIIATLKDSDIEIDYDKDIEVVEKLLNDDAEKLF